MNIEDKINYVAPGTAFLGITAFAIRILWKLQSSSEMIYERRSKNQVVTIAKLDETVEELREEMSKCHQERVTLSSTVANQDKKIRAQAAAMRSQGNKIRNLEKKVADLKKSK